MKFGQQSIKYGAFLWKKYAENAHQMLVPKQPLHATLLKIRYFKRGLSKNLKKANLVFSFALSLFKERL